MSEPIKVPTERSYVLKCKIEAFIKTITEKHASYQSQLVFLVPQESDQRTSFLSAWLPETSEEHFELAGIIPPPIDSPCRFAIRRANGDCGQHHLVVMSTGVAKLLAAIAAKGKGAAMGVTVKILPESDIEAADLSKDDDDGNYQVGGA